MNRRGRRTLIAMAILLVVAFAFNLVWVLR